MSLAKLQQLARLATDPGTTPGERASAAARCAELVAKGVGGRSEVELHELERRRLDSERVRAKAAAEYMRAHQRHEAANARLSQENASLRRQLHETQKRIEDTVSNLESIGARLDDSKRRADYFAALVCELRLAVRAMPSRLHAAADRSRRRGDQDERVQDLVDRSDELELGDFIDTNTWSSK